MMLRIFFFLLLMTGTLRAQSIETFQCILRGEIVGSASKALLLSKITGDFHSKKDVIRIPVKHNNFQVEINTAFSEGYQIYFEDEFLKTGGGVPIYFVSEPGIIQFKLYPGNRNDENIISGGSLTSELINYQLQEKERFAAGYNELIARQNELNSRNEFSSEEFKLAQTEMRQIRKQYGEDHDKLVIVYQKMSDLEKTGKHVSDKGAEWLKKYDSLEKEKLSWRYVYIKEHPTLVSYYFMVFDLYRSQKREFATQLIREHFPAFKALYVDHPYTTRIENELAGRSIIPGAAYIDFIAQNSDGKNVVLSEIINNKVALIDLWGSWCGPCIAKTRRVAPIYDRYKEKGFVIVGVAREFKSDEAWRRTLKREGWPWLNLIELDDKNKIWNKYGIGNGSGFMVLVDKTGTILAVDPKPEDLEKILKEKL